MPADLDQAKYVSFTTYKKNGDPVSLPVWVVPFDGGYAFTTDLNSHKVRRVRNDARATLRVCDMRGKVAEGTVTHTGAAVVLPDADVARVTALVKKKYRIGWALLGAMELWRKVTGKADGSADSAIKVTLNQS
ncbi:MAG: PPOX class F420-dependent oxidoreductase [Actinomycetota bacterium]